MTQRYEICGDDSGHDYFVPVEQVTMFYAWVESTQDAESNYGGPDFEANRIDGSFTFTDPRNE